MSETGIKISATDEPQGGLFISPQQQAGGLEGKIHYTSPSANAPDGDPSETFHILHVEDDPFMARLMREILGNAAPQKFSVESAGSLAIGMERLAANSVQAVLLDLTLPDSRGLDTVVRVRSQFAQVPIVVLSGQDDEMMALAALKLGAQDFLVKGAANSQVIIRSIRYAMERKRADDELRAGPGARPFAQPPQQHSRPYLLQGRGEPLPAREPGDGGEVPVGATRVGPREDGL